MAEHGLSPLREGEEVTVVSMADPDDCGCEMFVEVEWMGREMGMPLEQLIGVDVDAATEEAIADWHCWVGRGYSLC